MEKAKGGIGRFRNLSTSPTACASRERMGRTCGWPLPEPETWPYEFLATGSRPDQHSRTVDT